MFKARDRKTNRVVALKKVRMENEKEGVSHVRGEKKRSRVRSHMSAKLMEMVVNCDEV